MTGNVFVSIIVPIYNKEQYIRSMITSVISQTVSNWELLLVDNQSTDNSIAVAKQVRDKRINLITCPIRTGGPGAPRNFGLKHARGDWVLFLDADDTLEPTHLETLLSDSVANPNAAIIAGHWQEYADTNLEHRTLKAPSGYEASSASFPEETIAVAPWACHAALVRREVLNPPYLWVEELDPYLSEDTAFWFRLLTCCSVAYSDTKSALYRRVENARDRHQDVESWFTGIHAVLQNNIAFLESQNLPLTANHCEALMRRYSDIYLLARRQKRADIATESLRLAQYWLDRCASLSGLTTFPLRIRHWLTLKPFLQIQHWRQQYL